MKAKTILRCVMILSVALFMGLTSTASSAQKQLENLPDTTVRVSVSSSGEQGNSDSFTTSITADGRYVAFASSASNLVSEDTNEVYDVFMHDMQTGMTERVSLSSTGEQGNGQSFEPSISADGRYVAFYSDASNLVSGDTNGFTDIFVHDRQTGETIRASVSSTGEQADGLSGVPSISADGRSVAFYSEASNLVSGDTNGYLDVFVHDMQTGETSRVSVSSIGEQADNNSTQPSISADGRYVAFQSQATNLVNEDTNGAIDVFVYDCETAETQRVSVSTIGEQGNEWSVEPSIAADGRYVAFMSTASNLVSGDTNATWDVFVHDLQTGETTRISLSSAGEQGNGYSQFPSISANGRFIAFVSGATNLVPGDTNGVQDAFLYDRQNSENMRISVSSGGEQGNDVSQLPAISEDGLYVAYNSLATNLVGDDTNGAWDIFVYYSLGVFTTMLPIISR